MVVIELEYWQYSFIVVEQSQYYNDVACLNSKYYVAIAIVECISITVAAEVSSLSVELDIINVQ